MKNILKICMICMLLGLLSVSVLSAPYQRKVMRIHNSEDPIQLIDNELDRGLEMVMNYLGMNMDYYDIIKGLPDDDVMKDYNAIVVWLYDYEFKGALKYWEWVDHQLENKKRLILLQQPRPGLIRETGQSVQFDYINEVLSKMNYEIGAIYSELPPDIELISKDSDMVEFERTLKDEITQFYTSRSYGKENKTYLKLRLKSKNMFSDVIVTTPLGGLVMGDYVYHMDPYTYKKQWRINPFKFFGESFGITNHPRMDYTTKNGKRIFYSHIDGDGFNNVSSVGKRVRKKKLSGEVIMERILKKYSKLPITASVITSEMQRDLHAKAETLELVKEMYRLPNIEAASHTFSHPLIWDKTLIHDGDLEKYKEYIRGNDFSNGALLPHKIPNYEFDPKVEIVDSVAFINRELLPENKTCKLVLWSGNTLPNEKTLKVAKDAGLLNLNGGDGRLDDMYPSYFYMAPLYRKVGDQYQIFTSNANDNIYIKGEDKSTRGSFQSMITSFERSESPYRVSPINIYYHFFSGAHKASLTALENLHEWVIQQDIFPMYASEYVGVVNGFINTKINRINANVWEISNNGECQTVRFDETKLVVDMKRSKGILGYNHYQNSLYIHLDESQNHKIVLTKFQGRQPYLESSTSSVETFKGDFKSAITFSSNVYGVGTYNWKFVPRNTRFKVSIKTDESSSVVFAKSDKDGNLTVSINDYNTVDIKIEAL